MSDEPIVSEVTNEVSAGERIQQQRLLHAQLGGATESWTMPKDVVRHAVMHLSDCVAHGGVHHFAVTGEGTTLSCSSNGIRCLQRGGILPASPAEREELDARLNGD